MRRMNEGVSVGDNQRLRAVGPVVRANDEMPAVTHGPHRPLDLDSLLEVGVRQGDASNLLPRLAPSSVDLFFTSPPYADQRAYSRIHPDRYVDWFLPFARSMFEATKETGSMVINIKNRVAKDGPLRGQRHPYVFQLVIALQNMGWRWVEECICTGKE